MGRFKIRSRENGNGFFFLKPLINKEYKVHLNLLIGTLALSKSTLEKNRARSAKSGEGL